MIEGQFNTDQQRAPQELNISEESGHFVRTFEHAVGSVAFIGHCLSPDDEIEATLDRVAATNDKDRITHLAGSYAAIIRTPNKTTLYSDIAGQFPFYYSQSKGAVYYSTDAELTSTHASGMPDKLGLSVEIAQAHVLDQACTRYDGVRRLPGAYKLELSDGQVHPSPYEQFATTDASFEEAVVDVRAALHGAIAGRLAMNKIITSDFSGGLDSTSLAFLTLAQLPKTAELQAFHSHFPEFPNGDLHYAQTYAALDDRIKLHTIALPTHQYNFESGKPLRPTYKQLADIKQAGGAIHIDGTGSDALFNISPACLYDRWHTEGVRGVTQLLSHIIMQARLANASPAEYIQRVTTRPRTSYDIDMLKAAQALRRGALSEVAESVEVNEHALGVLRPKMLEALGSTIEAANADLRNMGIADRQAVQELWASGRAAQNIRSKAQSQGVHIHFPFLDHRVIRASTQIAAYKRHDPQTLKALLHYALEGQVPDELLSRKTKGGYSSSAYSDIRKNADNFRRVLGPTSLLARLGVIDVTAMQNVISGAELGLGHIPLAVPVVAVETEQWLQLKYKVPKQPASYDIGHASTSVKEDGLPFPLSLAPHVRAVEDVAGTVLYNLRTKELRSLHHAASTALHTVKDGGTLRDVHDAVASVLPDEQHAHVPQLTASILTTLIDRGFLQNEHRPFVITTTTTAPGSTLSEISLAKEVRSHGDVRKRDYWVVMNGILKARQLLKTHDLYTIASRLAAHKADYPWADAAHAKRLLYAGHIIGRYYIERLACQELSLAVVLAEAQRRRRLDWTIGVAADPRRLHAWPEIRGNSITTEHDDVVEGNYIAFDSW
jgi:asparagine synthase (glutamine-hydrolysing)